MPKEERLGSKTLFARVTGGVVGGGEIERGRGARKMPNTGFFRAPLKGGSGPFFKDQGSETPTG